MILLGIYVGGVIASAGLTYIGDFLWRSPFDAAGAILLWPISVPIGAAYTAYERHRK